MLFQEKLLKFLKRKGCLTTGYWSLCGLQSSRNNFRRFRTYLVIKIKKLSYHFYRFLENGRTNYRTRRKLKQYRSCCSERLQRPKDITVLQRFNNVLLHIIRDSLRHLFRNSSKQIARDRSGSSSRYC